MQLFENSPAHGEKLSSQKRMYYQSNGNDVNHLSTLTFSSRFKHLIVVVPGITQHPHLFAAVAIMEAVTVAGMGRLN